MKVIPMDKPNSTANHHKDNFNPPTYHSNSTFQTHNPSESCNKRDRHCRNSVPVSFNSNSILHPHPQETCQLKMESPIDTKNKYFELSEALGSNDQDYLMLVFDYLSGKVLKCEFDHFVSKILAPEKSKFSFLLISFVSNYTRSLIII